MKPYDRIIEEYIEADMEKRLHLFLECPSLRNQFIEIDLGKYRAGDNAMKKTGKAPGKSFLWRWQAAAANCCLKFRRT